MESLCLESQTLNLKSSELELLGERNGSKVLKRFEYRRHFDGSLDLFLGHE